MSTTLSRDISRVGADLEWWFLLAKVLQHDGGHTHKYRDIMIAEGSGPGALPEAQKRLHTVPPGRCGKTHGNLPGGLGEKGIHSRETSASS